jgi:hypothetical protein
MMYIIIVTNLNNCISQICSLKDTNSSYRPRTRGLRLLRVANSYTTNTFTVKESCTDNVIIRNTSQKWVANENLFATGGEK